MVSKARRRIESDLVKACFYPRVASTCPAVWVPMSLLILWMISSLTACYTMFENTALDMNFCLGPLVVHQSPCHPLRGWRGPGLCRSVPLRLGPPPITCMAPLNSSTPKCLASAQSASVVPVRDSHSLVTDTPSTTGANKAPKLHTGLTRVVLTFCRLMRNLNIHCTRN